MNPGIVIKQLEELLREKHQIKGGFKTIFHYEDFTILYTLLDRNKKQLLTSPEKLCELVYTNRLKLYFPLNIQLVFDEFIKDKKLDPNNISREKMALLLFECLNYCYRLYARIPTSLY